MRLLAAVLLLAALAGCTADEPSIATPAGSAAALAGCATGRPATGDGLLPALSLPCLDGRGTVALRSLAGTPTVVNFWASWCGPCRDELPAFSRLHATGKVRVLGVASSDRPAAAAAYAADAKLPFPSLLDEDGAVLRALGRRGLPETVFVDAAGRVRAIYQGVPLTDATLAARVRAELGVDV